MLCTFVQLKKKEGVLLSFEKVLKNSLYSLDKLTMEFAMKQNDMQKLMEKLQNKTNVTAWTSFKMPVCRYNYSINVTESIDKMSFENGSEKHIKQTKESFWIGIEPNWKNFDSEIKYGRIEFNPSKIDEYLEFQEIYGYIKSNVAKYCLNPIKYDIAIDMPVSRDKVYLIKDNRTYEEYANSKTDKTQYLGKRNSHGRIKLYNKALELKLDNIDLTRLECTIEYKERSREEFERLLPTLYILDNYQIPIECTGTDKVLLIACLGDMSLKNELGRKKKEKIESYLKNMTLSINVDIEKYNSVLEFIESYRK
jgi:hypothetical protein